MFSLVLSFRRFMRAVFAALLSAVLLASCADATYDVTIYSDNSYESTLLLSFPSENIVLFGGINELERRLDEIHRRC